MASNFKSAMQEQRVILRVLLVVVAFFCFAGCSDRQTSKIVAEKYPGTGWTTPKLVSTSRYVCKVGADEALAAELGKPWTCAWYLP